MHIVIYSMGLPFDGNTVKAQSLGGSESAAYYQARELAKRGHRVELFTNTREQKLIDGVKYCPIGDPSEQHPLGSIFEPYAASTPHDVLIMQRHPLAFHKKWAAKVCIWQLHDLALHRSTTQVWHGLWQTDWVTCVSEWHRQQVIKVWGIKPSRVVVVPNAVDDALYAVDLVAPKAFQHENGTFKMLYQSRPERGLEHLVKPGGIMDRLAKAEVRAHLYVCGYANTRPEMAQYYAQLQQWGALLPNVTELGALSKPDLSQVQRCCDLLCYPTEFMEVSCITAMEAMHAGLPLLSSECGALPETCEGGGHKLIPLTKDGLANEDLFVEQIKSLCHDHVRQAIMRKRQLEVAAQHTWAGAVDVLESLVYRTIRESRTPERMVRHGFEHSDLDMVSANIDGNPTDSVHYPKRAEWREAALYDFIASDEKYGAHYARHQGEYYDGPGAQAVGEDVTGTLRFRGVLVKMSEKQDAMKQQPMRVLDFGCAHGHYLMPFARMMPASEFYGVDISTRAIGAALEWRDREKLANVSLASGGLDQVEAFAAIEEIIERDGTGSEVVRESYDNRFDVIMANEVLEHVPDPWAVIERLRKCLKPDGWLIATTPVGRWEHSGTENFRKAREHLWHFSRAELLTMLDVPPAQFENVVLFAPAGTDRAHGVLGSYVWHLVNSAPEFKRLSVEERMFDVVPRQTISLCMIVKDAEKTLQKCIESVVDWVDEVVIAIDPTTTDRTRQLIERLREDFPLRSFVVLDGLSALKDGFAAARNVTLDASSGDWILWCDADEEVQSPWELWKFAKESCVDGFGLPQVHYSCSPPAVLTTDRPTRFFRKASGARFHGYVHEHPEVEQGKAVPYAYLRDEVQFLHSGYVNEEVRRKRYARNAPLLRRDMIENPKRSINKFLSIRDITQGVVFGLERTGGTVTPEQHEAALSVIKLFEDLLDVESPVRMIIDSMEYYSAACQITQQGFDAEITMGFAKPPFPTLNVNTAVKGRFRNKDVYMKLVNRIAEEATKHYADQYL